MTHPAFAAARARGIKQIRLVIYQPKVYQDGPREWIVSLDDLEKFAALARSKAQSTRLAEETHGKMDQAEWERTFLHSDPNEVDCAFCRAMATCPAAAAKTQQVVGADFEAIAEPGAPASDFIGRTTPAADLATKMAAAGFVEDWCKAVRAETERRLMAGQEVPGFGLELGRQGPRKWKNAEEAETLLRKQFRLKTEDAYNLKLKSPTQVEELTKGKEPLVGPRQWAKAQALVTRADPKPSVKPSSTITKPYTPAPLAAGDFSAVPDCDLV